MHVLANLGSASCRKYDGVPGFVGRFTNLILNQEESKVMSKEELQVLSEVTTQLVLLLA
jgi:hypothetical protein